MTPLLLVLFICQSLSKNLKLELTHHEHYLIMFTDDRPSIDDDESTNHLNFQLDFDSTTVTLSQQYKTTPFYLDKNKHKQINDKMNIEYKLIKKKPTDSDNEDQQEIHGIIGMKKGSQFIRALKSVLNITEMKLWFKIYENIIEVIPANCTHPLFGPYQISMRAGTNNKDFKINKLSLNFKPKQDTFLTLIDKKENPFKLNNEEIKTRLDLQFYNQLQSLPLQTLMGKNCLKYSGNQRNYECTLPSTKGQKKQSDPGLLMFEFDPILCTNVEAIQLEQEGRVDNEGYFWGHILMIMVQFVLLCVYIQREWLDESVDKLTQKYQ